MGRKVKTHEAGLPQFLTQAELNKEMLEMTIPELRREIKNLQKRNARVADTYLSSFGFSTAKFPQPDAFEKQINTLGAVGAWKAGTMARLYSTGSTGKALPYLTEIDKLIGHLVWWEGKCEGLIPCEFPPKGSEILEASAAGRKLIILRDSSQKCHVLGEAVIVFSPNSTFTAYKLDGRPNRLAMVRPLSDSEFESLRNEIKLDNTQPSLVHDKDPARLLKKYRLGT